MVAGEAKLSPVPHDPGEHIEVFFVDKPAAMMPGFRPRVGEKQKNTFKDRGGELWKQRPHIFVKNPDVSKIGVFDEPRERRDTIAKRLAPEKAYVGVCGSLRGQVLARSKPDFEPHWRGRREQCSGIATRHIRRRNPESVKHRLKPRAAARAEGMTAPAPVEMGFVGGLYPRSVNHRFLQI